MPLTENEKSRARYHLGYPVTAPVASIQLGIPKPLQSAFLMEDSLQLLTEDQYPQFRSILQVLDQTELNLIDAQCYLSAQRLGDIELRTGDAGKSTPDLLEKEYRRWANRLSDMLGWPLYAYSARFSSGVSGSIPVRR